MASVEIDQVGKSYGALEVIKDLNLHLEDGKLTVFVGPSGCGKSTLLRMIAGLERITAGEIRIDGKRANDADPIERGVAMVFQNYALYPHMTVEQNIGFSLRMAGLTRPDIAARVRAAAQTLQIEELLSRKPAQLSGGQRQRVAIGRAIVRDPKVFLFDEPLSNLDAELRVSMRVEIAKLHQKLQNTMIYVTHDQTEAMTLADRIVVMRAGKIEQVGTPEELYEEPANLFVAGFIGSPRMNIIDATGQGEAVRFGDNQSLPFAGPAGPLKLGIRPEHMHPGGDGDQSLQVRVDVVENLGGTRYIYGSLPSGEPVIVEDRDKRAPGAGEVMKVGFRSADVRLFTPDGQRLDTTRAKATA
ncbi:ABC transporter ATP-binding protein [Pelagovum pacificum]|uniref:sn-glycerol-3-phosphate ABC transporter ATP-binding protein UgpC n=1 Tax=Pelagovum pacificum TaxID=2588711 RepID=A0A5C5GCK3_9RHOB|nr:sn-glycerol-3-phosphate ABC transporter ATP-binding protein UgpC [Pelagovum pacificum]QQA44339.1 sn-glycerol-3-phosphate ABC transporter ATP-binding protein UgpC [Pelagovum pacificum]TNY32542.1 sn-glycerol-3-phosphate ABC transporter ATP-binding protein UgpC [Pelagovum pacificum]